MKLYIDDGNVEEVAKFFDLGVFSGISTNPTILRRTGRKPLTVVKEIIRSFTGAVFVQCVSAGGSKLLREGQQLFALAPDRVTIKLPFGQEALLAMKEFRKLGIPVSITGIFSLPQVIMSCEAGADYVAPYAGRMENLGVDLDVVRQMQVYISNGGYETRLVAASFKTMAQVAKMAVLPIHGMSLPIALCDEVFKHSGTVQAIRGFNADWEAIAEREWVDV